MTNIDWSCKHNILISWKDEPLRPMDEPYFRARKIAPGTWQILSSGDYSYLLKGKKQALLIDSGYGAGNIREYCEKLCGVPVPWICNTHEHFDHTANDGYFDLVFLTEKAHETATIPFQSFAGVEFPRDYPVQYVRTGDVIPLAGRELIAIEMGEHSPGGVAYLDRSIRALYSGDEIWDRKPLHSKTPSEFAKILERLMPYRADFDMLYAGNGEYKAEVVDKLIALCRRAEAGDTGESEPEEKAAPGPYEKILDDGTIVYDRMRPHFGDGGVGIKRKNGGPMHVLRDGDVELIFPYTEQNGR